MTEKEAKTKLKEIKKAMQTFPKEVRRQERAHREEMKIKKAFGKLSLASIESPTPEEKVHPWRLCPRNQFYRSKHTQSSYVKKDGTRVNASEHPNECVINKTGRDQLYAAEIQKIAESRSKDVTWPKVIMLYKNYRSLKEPQLKKFLGLYEALRTHDKSKLKAQ